MSVLKSSCPTQVELNPDPLLRLSLGDIFEGKKGNNAVKEGEGLLVKVVSADVLFSKGLKTQF
jgi:hypothetical protein